MDRVHALARALLASDARQLTIGELVDAVHGNRLRPCRTTPQPLYFPTVGRGRQPANLPETTRGLCRLPDGSDCPVATQCALLAIRLDCDHGVWGGLDETTRNKVRRLITPQRRKRNRPRARGGLPAHVRDNMMQTACRGILKTDPLRNSEG